MHRPDFSYGKIAKIIISLANIPNAKPHKSKSKTAKTYNPEMKGGRSYTLQATQTKKLFFGFAWFIITLTSVLNAYV